MGIASPEESSKLHLIINQQRKGEQQIRTTLPFKLESTATSVTVEVKISVRKNEPVFLDKDDQHVAPCPAIGIADVAFALKVELESAVEFEAPLVNVELTLADGEMARLKVVAPTAGSVAKRAFFPGISVIENG